MHPLQQQAQRDALNGITGPGSIQDPPTAAELQRLDDITAGAWMKCIRLYELAHALAGQGSISETGDVIAESISDV